MSNSNGLIEGLKNSCEDNRTATHLPCLDCVGYAEAHLPAGTLCCPLYYSSLSRSYHGQCFKER